MVTPRALEPVAAFGAAFAEMRARLPGSGYSPLAALRSENFARFEALGIPTPRHELWKYTSVARHANVPLAPARKTAVGVGDIVQGAVGGPRARRLIFVDGHPVPELSHTEGLPAGAKVSTLADALERDPERVTEALRAVEDERSFTALNAAFAASGAWIELEDGVSLDEPLQLLFLSRGGPSTVMSHPRIVVRLGRRARLRLLETHVGWNEGMALINLVSQFDLADGATLDHDRAELFGPGRTMLGKAFLRLDRGARVAQTSAMLGGTLVRNESEVDIEGSDVDCRLSGAYMPRGEEHIDNLIRIRHAAPGSRSDQFYKGVLTDRARAVFAGKIHVTREAQQTNAYQKNDNLLLSDDAEIDAKPELEIYADDVKCSHGATCGDLDAAALFYLRSRGLSRDVASGLLTYAFINEVVDQFAEETVRALVRKAALTRLPGGAALEINE